MIRLFIAIPVPEEIKSRISDLIAGFEGIRGLPQGIRFAPPENWHFTLTFLGYQPEPAAPLVKETIINFRASQQALKLELKFERVIFGPPGPQPRMIWLTSTRETSEKLGKIKKELEDRLEMKGVKWQHELRPYQGHLTLARFPELPRRNLPAIEKEINWQYEAKEINLMKSTLKKTGAEYEVLL